MQLSFIICIKLSFNLLSTPTTLVFEQTDTFFMAESIFPSIDLAHEESYDDVVLPRKNLHALISHLYPPFYIQVMDAFSNYQPLDFEYVALNPSIQKLTNMDMVSSSSESKDWEQFVRSPRVSQKKNFPCPYLWVYESKD